MQTKVWYNLTYQYCCFSLGSYCSRWYLHLNVALSPMNTICFASFLACTSYKVPEILYGLHLFSTGMIQGRFQKSLFDVLKSSPWILFWRPLDTVIFDEHSPDLISCVFFNITLISLIRISKPLILNSNTVTCGCVLTHTVTTNISSHNQDTTWPYYSTQYKLCFQIAQVVGYKFGIPLKMVDVKPSNNLVAPNNFSTANSMTTEAVALVSICI